MQFYGNAVQLSGVRPTAFNGVGYTGLLTVRAFLGFTGPLFFLFKAGNVAPTAGTDFF